MVVFPHGTAPRTAVVPIGDPQPAACEAVAETLRETFELSAPIRSPIDPPPEDGADDADVADANRVLDSLADETDGIDLVVGVTDRAVGLRHERVPLFGVGTEFGTVGVVSTSRLLEGTEPSALERERLEKEALSVVGTMLGLRTRFHYDGRTSEQPCVVSPGSARYELDEAPSTYCEECWNALSGESRDYEPPAPDDWIVEPRPEADGLQWWEYPLVPIGLAVIAAYEFAALLGSLADRLPGPGIGSARDLPQPVHTVYRIGRFWTNVALYLVAIFCWLLVTVSAHDRFFGPETSDAAVAAILIGSLALGVFSAWMVKGILGGIYDGLRLAAADGRN